MPDPKTTPEPAEQDDENYTGTSGAGYGNNAEEDDTDAPGTED